MTEQLQHPAFRLAPEDVMAEALALVVERGRCLGRFVGFSGGGDSIVAAHWAITHGYADALFHIETGTALPGVRQHVDRCAELLGVPVVAYQTPWDEYRRLVLGSAQLRRNGQPDQAAGFPGPALHGTCYTRLKERQFEALVRNTKAHKGAGRYDRLLMVTGLRRGESQRRRARRAVTRKSSMVFANPLIDWTNAEIREYRAEHNLPTSDVSALIHQSGECTCGAFAAPGEREMLKSLWPEWWEANHGQLEREAEAAGLSRCRWGERADTPPDVDAGEFCSSCEMRLFGEA